MEPECGGTNHLATLNFIHVVITISDRREKFFCAPFLWEPNISA